MRCENLRCPFQNNLDNSQDLNSCEYQNCHKKFCSHDCLYCHFLEIHNKQNSILSNISFEKILITKFIENTISGVYLKENLIEYKNKISPQLNNLLKTKKLNLTFDQIENDYTNLDYFYYFFNTNFENLYSSKKVTNTKYNKIIGSGAFGDVYLVKNNLDGKLFAIKQLDKDRIKENGIDYNIVLREINTHFKLIHKNVARLYDYYEDKKAFYLILEYVENGTLFNKIQKSNGLSEEKALKCFVQVSSAIYFLHENKLIHRDIKPENCLIDKYDNVKLCDFGWTVEVTKGERVTFCGTYEYMAPEIIKEVPYNESIDVWSLGILLYELIHSFSPFRAKANKNNPIKYDPTNQIMNNIIKNKLEFEKQLSKDCKDLITRILNPNIEQRLQIQDIFIHKYIIEYFQKIMNIKFTKLFDIFDKACINRRFIFIEYCSENTNKSFNDNQEGIIVRKSNDNENKDPKLKEEKDFNQKKNIFFYKIKSEFLSKLKFEAENFKTLKKNETLNNYTNKILPKPSFNYQQDNLHEILDDCFSQKITHENFDNTNNNNILEQSQNNSINGEGSVFLKSYLTNKNNDLFDNVLDKIQYKKPFRTEISDICDEINKLNENSKLLVSSRNILKKNSKKNDNDNISINSQEKINLNNVNNKNANVNIEKNKITLTLKDENNNLNILKYDTKEDFYDDINRISNIISIMNNSTENSMMREIKEINVEIENKNKKFDNFLESKNDMRKFLEENDSSSKNNHNRKHSDLKDLNFNNSNNSELKICKNTNLSITESTDDTIQQKYYSEKNINNNFVISSNKNLDKKNSSNNIFSSSNHDKSNLINSSGNTNQICVEKDMTYHNPNIGYYTNVQEEKVKDFSILSSKNCSENNSKNKLMKKNTKNSIDFDNGKENINTNVQSKKNVSNLLNNNSIFSVCIEEKNNTNSKENKHKKISSIVSNMNSCKSEKNNILNLKKNRKSVSRKSKDQKKLIKLKDFEEILVDSNNKSFEERNENCTGLNKFFGLFNVFKCGQGHP